MNAIGRPWNEYDFYLNKEINIVITIFKLLFETKILPSMYFFCKTFLQHTFKWKIADFPSKIGL